MGSALLVFLVNLSIEQSISQRHKHKIIGYTVLFCISTWKSQCRGEAGSAGVMLWVNSEWPPLLPPSAQVEARWGDQHGLSSSGQGQTGCKVSGELPWQACLCCPVPCPLAFCWGDSYRTISAGPSHLGAVAQGWSHTLIGCGLPLGGGNGCTDTLKGHFSERYYFSVRSSLMSK